MCTERLCRKGKGHRYELIAGEIFFGLAALAMLLCAVLIPLEENVTYISYIFYGIFALAAAMTAFVAAKHIAFERLPEFLSKITDDGFLRDNYNSVAIRLTDVKEVSFKNNKDKYGREYSFGTLIIVTNSHTYKIKYAENPRGAKEKIDAELAEISSREI